MGNVIYFIDQTLTDKTLTMSLMNIVSVLLSDSPSYTCVWWYDLATVPSFKH